jgi:hypothetical protein
MVTISTLFQTQPYREKTGYYIDYRVTQSNYLHTEGHEGHKEQTFEQEERELTEVADLPLGTASSRQSLLPHVQESVFVAFCKKFRYVTRKANRHSPQVSGR